VQCRRGEPGGERIHVAGFATEQDVEDALEESAFPGELLFALGEEFEAERRARFHSGEEGGGEAVSCLSDGHQDERAPTHAQKVLVEGGGIGKRIHASSGRITEVEELLDERIQRKASADGAGEQRVGAAIEVLVNVLKVIAELKQNAP